MPDVELRELAYARSGDKGDTCIIGIMAKSPEIYGHLRAAITADAVKEHFGDMVQGEIEIYPMDNIESLAIVLRNSLGGGATKTLRFDQTGKAMGSALLRMTIDVPPALREEAQQRTIAIEGSPNGPK
ncbi:MAG: hypothetical protein OXB97_02845 [Rhodospirillales bacterium]|nr:hypothetical protein [Rhodospirillales bacterium]